MELAKEIDRIDPSEGHDIDSFGHAFWQTSGVRLTSPSVSGMIHHYSSFIDGGAGGAAIRLHQSLRGIGVDSRFVYSKDRNKSKAKSHLDVSHVEATWRPRGRWQRWTNGVGHHIKQKQFKFATRNQPGGRDLFTSPHGRDGTEIDRSEFSAGDVIHLHWISKFIDWQQFFESIPRAMPIVWTLHDMNPLTGGCHFSGGCDHFASGCGNCFQLGYPKPNDISHRILGIKKQSIRGRNLHVVAPSVWLIEQARKSVTMANAISFHRIPYSIDLEQFRPVNQQMARRNLGIEHDDFVIVFGAMGIGNARKGARQLVEALSSLAGEKRVRLLTFGNGQLPIGNAAMPAMTELGLLKDKVDLQMAYAAANLFVMPSLEDNLPLTGLEAMACGTPVVAFDSGGIPDYVRQNVTGRLAKSGSSEDLAKQLRWALEHVDQMTAMGIAARKMVESEYAAPTEAMAYQSLYRQILDQNNADIRRAA